MPGEITVDVNDRDIIVEHGDTNSVQVDLDDRDFIVTPSDGDITVEFGAVGLPGRDGEGLTTDLLALYLLART